MSGMEGDMWQACIHTWGRLALSTARVLYVPMYVCIYSPLPMVAALIYSPLPMGAVHTHCCEVEYIRAEQHTVKLNTHPDSMFVIFDEIAPESLCKVRKPYIRAHIKFLKLIFWQKLE